MPRVLITARYRPCLLCNELVAIYVRISTAANSVAQLAMIDEFQRICGFATREKAMLLLLDIGLEAVTSTGRRFWDKPTLSPEAPISSEKVD